MLPRHVPSLIVALLLAAALVFRGTAGIAVAGQQAGDSEPGAQASSTTNDSSQKGDIEPPAAKTPKKNGTKPSPEPGARLVGPDGKIISLPGNAAEEFLNWLRQRNVAKYAVNSVALEGTADDKRAELTATITVQILREAEGDWVRVPVFLNEAQLASTKHTFLGDSPDTANKSRRTTAAEGTAAYSDYTQEAGYRWWFRGKGYHRLRISLVVPVSKTVAQRRLRLKLPPLSAASIVSLRMPDPKLVVIPPRNGDWRVTRAGKSASLVRVVGVGGELDLQWRAVGSSQGRPSILQAQTSVVVDFTDEDGSVVLTALQRVQTLGGVGQVVVRLPAGCQVLAASGKYVKNYRVDSRGRATVEFTDPHPDVTEINWTLTRKLPTSGENLTLQGFEVEGAKVQSGDLAITRLQGLRIERLDEGNVAVRRIRSADFTVPELIRNKSLSSLYRFVQQPFRLNLKVSRVQPQVTVHPTIRLDVSEGKLVLHASFKVEVSDEGGTVRDLELHWPGWKTDGWTIRPLDADPLIERRTVNAKNDSAPIRLRLMGRRGGEFVVPLTAEREIAPAKGGVTIRLPVLAAAGSQPTTARATTLIVAREPNLTLDLTDRDEVPLTEISADGGEPGRMPRRRAIQGGDVLTRQYHIADAAVSLLTARIKAHPQRLSATTAIDLDPRPLGARVRQRISLRVEYVPVRTVRFEVPAGPAGRPTERIDFFDANGRPLPAQQVMSMTEKPLIEVRLERPTLGKIEFVSVAQAELPNPLAPGESTSLRVPLVQVEGVKFSQVRVQSPPDSKMELSLPADGWRRMRTIDGSPAWLSDAAVTSLTVQVKSPEVPRSRPFSIARALIRVSIDSAGTARYRAQYRVEGKPNAAVVFLPPRARIDSVYWGRQPVTALQRKSGDSNATTLVIPVPSAAAPEVRSDRLQPVKRPAEAGHYEPSERRLLTIDYHTAGEQTPGSFPSSSLGTRAGVWSAHDLLAPRFPDNVWIEETAWQVILPRDQHLSSFGAAYTPEFVWSPASFVWSRQATAEFENPENWIDAAAGPQWPVEVDGNSYVFRRYGPAENLPVQSMSRPLIVLVGAGLAWLIGILLVRFPRLRALSVLLTAGLAAAVSGLWFATQLQLLLQPALLGAALAVGIVGIDRLTRRRRAPASLTLAHPSDFVSGSRSSASDRPRSAPLPGSEESTSIRAPAAAPMSSVLGTGGIRGGEPLSTTSEARRQG